MYVGAIPWIAYISGVIWLKRGAQQTSLAAVFKTLHLRHTRMLYCFCPQPKATHLLLGLFLGCLPVGALAGNTLKFLTPDWRAKC